MKNCCHNLFVVIQKERDGKYFAYAEKVHIGNNLAYLISHTKDISTFNILPTWKLAQQTAETWNETHKRNGTFDYI